MQLNKNKLSLILLSILNILFLGYYLMLAVYARPHFDDLHFLWKLKEMSIGGYVSDMYLARSGRFVGYFINGVVFKTILQIGSYWFLPIFFGVLGVFFNSFRIEKNTEHSIQPIRH